MPFLFDFDEAYSRLDDPEDELPEPAIGDFEYITSRDFSGCAHPASFIEPASAISKDEAARGVKIPNAKPLGKAGCLSKLLMWWILDKETAKRFNEEKTESARRAANLFSVLGPGLREIGGKTLRCEYDGGNDEGFAWLHSLNTGSGTLHPEAIIKALDETGIVDRLRAADLAYGPVDQPTESIIENVLEEAVYEWASLILGRFGGGPIQFYGAFTVDLDNRTVTDDPNAEVPKNGNCVYREDS